MDSRHFDSLTRRLGTTASRRQTVRLFAASAFATMLSRGAGQEAAAAQCRHLNERCHRRGQCCGAGRHRYVHCQDFGDADPTQPRVCCLDKGAPCDLTMTPDPCCGFLVCLDGRCMA